MRLGTRGSALALAQAHLVEQRLTALGAPVRIVTIATAGDRAVSAPFDAHATGIFVKELEEHLLAGRIDLAAHSLKDMTTTLPPGLVIGAVLARGSPLDALVTREPGLGVDDLPPGALVGTSSPRRRAQLLHYRRDLQVRPVRGNVDTRLRKLDAGDFDAVVLAHAGLERLGLTGRACPIPPAICLPAPGQGAIAVEMRAGDEAAAQLVRCLGDPDTEACVRAERAFLRALGAGCRAAVGALATVQGDALCLEGAVAHPHGESLLRGSARGDPGAAETVGLQLARELQQRGAHALIEAAR